MPEKDMANLRLDLDNFRAADPRQTTLFSSKRDGGAIVIGDLFRRIWPLVE